MIVNNKSDESKLLILKCDGISTATAAVVAILKGTLPDIIQDYSEIMEDRVPGSWLDESYSTKAHDFFENEVLDEPLEDAVETAATKAENFVSTIMSQNHAELQAISSNWLIDEVKVLRRFSNLWVVQVTGAKFPF